MNPVGFKFSTPERAAMASITATAPHQPCRHHNPPAVVSFESGGQVVALGNTNGQNQGEDIKVAFTTKHRGSELPYIGFRVKLKCDPTTSDPDRKSNVLFFKYHNDCFDCVHHKANEKEKEEFLGIMRNDAACREDVDKLYVIKLFKKESRGAEVSGKGTPPIGANAKINDTYNLLYSVNTCNVVTVWLCEYKNLAFHVQWALEYLKAASLQPILSPPTWKNLD